MDDNLLADLLSGFSEDREDRGPPIPPKQVRVISCRDPHSTRDAIDAAREAGVPEHNIYTVDDPAIRKQHAKLFLIYFGRTVRVVIGSANLTRTSFEGAWECFVVAEEVADAPTGPTTESEFRDPLIAEAHALTRRVLLGPNSVEDVETWETAQGQALLTTSRHEKLLRGLSDVVRNIPSARLLYITPFFSVEGTSSLLESLSCPSATLQVLTNRHSEFPESYRNQPQPSWEDAVAQLDRRGTLDRIRISCADSATIRQQLAPTTTSGRQFIHAKICFVFDGPAQAPSAAFVTSANLSEAAWQLNGERRNLEMGVVLSGLPAKELFEFWRPLVESAVEIRGESAWNETFGGVGRNPTLREVTPVRFIDVGDRSQRNLGEGRRGTPSHTLEYDPSPRIHLSGLGETLVECARLRLTGPGLASVEFAKVRLVRERGNDGTRHRTDIPLDRLDRPLLPSLITFDVDDLAQQRPVRLTVSAKTRESSWGLLVNRVRSGSSNKRLIEAILRSAPPQTTISIDDLEMGSSVELDPEALMAQPPELPVRARVSFLYREPRERTIAWIALPRVLSRAPWSIEGIQSAESDVRIQCSLDEKVVVPPEILEFRGCFLSWFEHVGEKLTIAVIPTAEAWGIEIPAALGKLFKLTPPIEGSAEKVVPPLDWRPVGENEQLSGGTRVVRWPPANGPPTTRKCGAAVWSKQIGERIAVFEFERNGTRTTIKREHRYAVRERLSDFLVEEVLPAHGFEFSSTFTSELPLMFAGWSWRALPEATELDFVSSATQSSPVVGTSPRNSGAWVGIHARVWSELKVGQSKTFEVSLAARAPNAIEFRRTGLLSLKREEAHIRLDWVVPGAAPLQTIAKVGGWEMHSLAFLERGFTPRSGEKRVTLRSHHGYPYCSWDPARDGPVMLFLVREGRG